MLKKSLNHTATDNADSTAIINGRSYRWPSNYQWKQLSKRHNADEFDAIRGMLKDWFNSTPVTIELAQEVADNALSVFDASGQALAFLRRANGR
ncbi:hypothetical protein FDK21_19265 [Cohaesibacter sp. CAU 1516]|uniref:hypothetical protein n=1 Tax=Cohaesibacter sp. CAU 1516 TaxID=2576038 RepID=UPI0010FEE51A|nr:hypothetical protein [Cohaesibacter sp. CAU 1516]TLP42654.1 hypothetical protein FDK21_19265 [Cohaesibacter sp. CAU 1516]